MFLSYSLFMGLSAQGEAACGTGWCGGGSSRDPSSRRRRHMLSLLIPRCRFPSCTLCSLGVVILHQLSREAWAALAPPSLPEYFFFFHQVFIFRSSQQLSKGRTWPEVKTLTETDLHLTLHTASRVYSGRKSYAAKYGKSPGVIHLSAVISGLLD